MQVSLIVNLSLYTKPCEGSELPNQKFSYRRQLIVVSGRPLKLQSWSPGMVARHSGAKEITTSKDHHINRWCHEGSLAAWVVTDWSHRLPRAKEATKLKNGVDISLLSNERRRFKTP